jgi:hypothetical protein
MRAAAEVGAPRADAFEGALAQRVYELRISQLRSAYLGGVLLTRGLNVGVGTSPAAASLSR